MWSGFVPDAEPDDVDTPSDVPARAVVHVTEPDDVDEPVTVPVFADAVSFTPDAEPDDVDEPATVPT